jgi:hypothetical protein
LGGSRGNESWVEGRFEGHICDLLRAGLCHCGELFAAASALREMQFVSGGFVESERLVEIGGQQFGVGASAAGAGIARKTSPEEAFHRLFVFLRRHDAILLL